MFGKLKMLLYLATKLRYMKVAVIGSGINDRLSSDFETSLNDLVEEKLYKITKYQIIGTYKCGKELRRERRKKERKNK